MGTITILNKHHFKCEPVDAIYIGRGSALGNPYPVNEYGRDNCIEMYKVWLDDQIKTGNEHVIDALDHIANKVIRRENVKLLCFCKPKACHGDVIKKAILDKIKE